jgi:hypothetical protein
LKWLEIIELRLSMENREKKTALLNDIIDEFRIELGNKSVKIYSHISLDTDFIIQLRHSSDKALSTGSKMGIQLVAALREIGLVNHNIWQEKALRKYKEQRDVK